MATGLETWSISRWVMLPDISMQLKFHLLKFVNHKWFSVPTSSPRSKSVSGVSSRRSKETRWWTTALSTSHTTDKIAAITWAWKFIVLRTKWTFQSRRFTKFPMTSFETLNHISELNRHVWLFRTSILSQWQPRYFRKENTQQCLFAASFITLFFEQPPESKRHWLPGSSERFWMFLSLSICNSECEFSMRNISRSLKIHLSLSI